MKRKTYNGLPGATAIRRIKPASCDEVYIEWLQHESRAHPGEYADLSDDQISLIWNPHIDDPKEAELRRVILFDGKRRRGILPWVPEGEGWILVEVERTDYQSLQTIHEASWIEITNGTFSLIMAATNFESYRQELWVPQTNESLQKVRAIDRFVLPRIDDGTLDRKLIIVQTRGMSRFVLEGNHRAVGICVKEVLPKHAEFIPHQSYLWMS